MLGAAAIAGCLLALALTLPVTDAAFTATTDNTGSSVAADTLDPPTGFVATGGVTVALDWTPTIDGYADGHRIYRSATPGGPYTEIADVTPASTASYVDSPSLGTHYYVARAYAGTWESVDTAETSGRAWRPFDCPADPDLRACLRFDVDLGGTYADHSGYGNTVLHSNGAQVEGITDLAADGSPAARYEMLDSASLDLTTGVTMEAWVRFDSFPATGRAGLIDNDGQYSLVYFAGTGLRCDPGPELPHVPVPLGVWFHVACTWDGSVSTLYIDGLPVVSLVSSTAPDTTNVDPVALLNSSPVFDEPLDGAMDNVRIWHVGRTQAQICADAGLTC